MGLKTPGQGIAFSLPVEEVVGFGKEKQLTADGKRNKGDPARAGEGNSTVPSGKPTVRCCSPRSSDADSGAASVAAFAHTP